MTQILKEELLNETATIRADGQVTAAELAQYLLSDAAAQGETAIGGFSGGLHGAARGVATHAFGAGGGLLGGYYSEESFPHARGICRTLQENGVIHTYDNEFIDQLVTALQAEGDRLQLKR